MAKKTKNSRKTKSKKKQAFSWWRLVGAAAVWGFAAAMLLLSWYGWNLPSIDDVKPVTTSPGITILASDGTLVARYGGVKGKLIKLEDLPAYVPRAVIAIEDRRFYSHFGIDPIGLARAMWVNVKARRFKQGGSTITQQLAKNLFLTPDRTLRRKVQEAMLALTIEYRFTKDDILEAYLNRVYYGGGAYGLEAAARVYFGKTPQNLTIWDAAVLAGLLKAPSRYAPTLNPGAAKKRGLLVLEAMQRAGYITKDMLKDEKSHARIRVVESKAGGQRRYFSDWIVNQIDSYIPGAGGDITVLTTFHPQMQNLAEEKTALFFKEAAAKGKVSQAAIVTMSKNGAILSMIGGRDYAQSQFNRASQAWRQPGSAFKPFVYLAALEEGYRPHDRMLDAPITEGNYRPENYGGQYHDLVTLTDALSLSLNTATIRLLKIIGTHRLMDVARRAGFSRDIRPELASGLGSSEVNLLELTNAYATIAGGGKAVWPYGVVEIRDAQDQILYSRGGAVFAPVFAYRDTKDLDRMLVQVVARGTGKAAQLPRGHVAGKTGTSQNYRDAWFIGYTDDLVTGIWMGNDDNTPMDHVTGGRYPARLWQKYMSDAIRLDLPRFVDGTAAPSFTDAFSKLLGKWSSGDFDSHAIPDNRPVYNR